MMNARHRVLNVDRPVNRAIALVGNTSEISKKEDIDLLSGSYQREIPTIIVPVNTIKITKPTITAPAVRLNHRSGLYHCMSKLYTVKRDIQINSR